MKRGRRILVLEVKFRSDDQQPEEMSLPGKTQRQRIRRAALWLTKRLLLVPHTQVRLQVVLWTGWLNMRVFEM